MRIHLTQLYYAREPRTPIAIMDLASYARSLGHEVDVGYCDEGRDLAEYDCIGMSSLSYTEDVYHQLANLRNGFDGRIVFGGKGTAVLSHDDYCKLRRIGVEVCFGAGERFFGDKYDINKYPAWDLEDFYALDRNETMTEAMSSRGCPYHCHFCHNTEQEVRWFDKARTVQNIRLILEEVGRHRVFLVDDVFAISAERMFDLLDYARQSGCDIRKKLAFFVHISCVNHKTIDAICAYSPQEVQIGIESGDDGMLSAMGKTFTADEAEEKLRLLSEKGIKCACLFLMGFPGETRRSLANTVDFVDRNRKYMSGWWVSYYQPVPFTVGWNMARERLGRNISGDWNTEVSYIDPNITKTDLETARSAVMKE